MKKYLAVLLAIVLTLSFFTFTVSAADMEPTPYALLCSECGRTMRGVQSYSEGGYFRVLSCDDYDGPHLHCEIYVQTNWVCRNTDCLEYGVVITGADPVYSHEGCGLKGMT